MKGKISYVTMSCAAIGLMLGAMSIDLKEFTLGGILLFTNSVLFFWTLIETNNG